MSQKYNSEVPIQEVSERDEAEKSSLVQESPDVQQVTTSIGQTVFRPLDLVEMYQRIDQEELEKIGIVDKQELSENALVDVH